MNPVRIVHAPNGDLLVRSEWVGATEDDYDVEILSTAAQDPLVQLNRPLHLSRLMEILVPIESALRRARAEKRNP